MIYVFQTFLFQDWILQHYPCITHYVSVPEYAEVMPCATSFIPLRGNQAVEPFKFYLDRLVVDDMHFNYVEHRHTQSFEEIVLYFRCLACGSRLTAPHFSERVIRHVVI